MCTCKEAFGQLIWDANCEIHTHCHVTMRGIPIQCILVAGHEKEHM